MAENCKGNEQYGKLVEPPKSHKTAGWSYIWNRPTRSWTQSSPLSIQEIKDLKV